MTIENLDHHLLTISSYLAEPLCWAYGFLRYRLVMPLDKFDTYSNTFCELAFRASIAGSAVLGAIYAPIPILGTAFTLGTASKIFRALGFYLQKNGFTHLRGQAPEKVLSGEAKIMTWNVCGIGGDMSIDHGGVIDWRARGDKIVETIVNEDPDVLVLQEIYDTALAANLIERLLPRYAHCFAHIGPNLIGSVSGGLIFSKCAYNQTTSTSFDNNHWTLNRTFVTLDFKDNPESQSPAFRLVGTHLIHDDNEKRKEQVEQIVKTLGNALATLVVGDLNLERDLESEGGAILDPYFTHAYTGDEPTATNELVKQWDPNKRGTPGSQIDYISLYKHGPPLTFHDTHLVHAFDKTYNTRTALSDHNAVVTTIRF